MAKIFNADTDYFVVADDIDAAVEKYHEERSQYPTTIAVYKEDGFVITESNVIEINTGVLPAGAEADGATVTPTPNVFIKEGDSITLQATPSVNYPTFVEWQDGSGAQLSTENPYTYTVGAAEVVINAVFSA
jgi:hypothetical protein